MRPVPVAAFIFTCCAAASLATQEAPPVDWIKTNAIPLRTVLAGSGFEDMRPIARLVGGARIVSLGEATHGSREFFQLKHRMLEFLATELGFTIFAIEANMPESYRVNDYVLNGTGDPAELLREINTWPWDTEEVLAMIRWMRVFNASGRGRVQFTGFDMQAPAASARIVNDFVAKYDSDAIEQIQAATTAITAPPSVKRAAAGMVVGAFPVAIAAGKQVRFSGYIKTQDVAGGAAGLWWRVNGPGGKVLAFDNMQSRGPRGTSNWTRYDIDLAVPANAVSIVFGAGLPASGTAWFDDLTIEIDGKPFIGSEQFDFGFESGVLRGLATDGAGYQIGIVQTGARTGANTLRIAAGEIPAATAPAGPSPEALVALWKAVVGRLDGQRASYRASGADEAAVAWAIQNARVALQCAEMRANPASRDRSMADNVKWILHQNPKAKVVLWAHNGHVATGGGFGDGTMGATLRQTYGSEMFVFGFAFGDGSFQALAPQTAGGPRNFTVPRAPDGTLDATLAAAGMPLYALDLRQAPGWFRQRRGSRQIGALYSSGQPMTELAAAEAYDTIFFIQTTSAAVKNPGR